MIKSRRGPPGICALILALRSGPSRRTALVAATGLSIKTVQDWLGEFKACGLVRIGGWEKDSRGYMQVPQWQWVEAGTDPADVVCPRVSPKSAAERAKQWRRRRKAANEAAMFKTEFAGGVSPWR